MAKNRDPDNIIAQWMERDLTLAAERGELAPAFEVQDVLAQIVELLAAGRHPILVGECGVGKTSIIHELVRRSADGSGLPELAGRRVLQLSLQRRASALPEPNRMRPEMQILVEALQARQGEVVPFFRDVQLAADLGLGPQLHTLSYLLSGPILCEGRSRAADDLFENSPELEQQYVPLPVEEPGVQRMARLLECWALEQRRNSGREYTPASLDRALQLTHRLLSRTHQPRKSIELLRQVTSFTPAGQPIDDTSVLERFCAAYQVPRQLVDPDAPLDLGALESRFQHNVLGQPQAVQAMVRILSLIKAGLSDIRRPFGVYLFVGPTGVGKTHVAQMLAEYMFGGRERMLRLNMADHAKEGAAGTLFGNPDDYRPAHVRGLLTTRLLGHPFGVLLLDEFEKAHTSVHDRMLQLFDEGSFINGAGETVNCRSMIIIATSNTGAEVYRGQVFGFTVSGDTAEQQREVNRVLEQKFRFEFLSRFDQVVHFHPLSRQDIRIIAQRELSLLQERSGLRTRNLRIEVDESLLDWLVVHGYDPYYGARFLRRTIERDVVARIAEVLVRERPAAGEAVELTVRHNRVLARVARPAGPEKAPRASVTLPVGQTHEQRRMDLPSLEAEARTLLQEAEPRLAALDDERRERSALISRMNDSGFWSDTEQRAAVLDRFRALDVAIHTEQRLARPIARLAERFENRDLQEAERVEDLARHLERAAAALRDWRERLAEEGPSACWMFIASADPLHPAGSWVGDLATMELNWCRRMRLAARVVAFELSEEVLARVVLDVEGPGSSAYLEMERGLHRLHRPQGKPLRARIDIIPKGPPTTVDWPTLRSVRQRQGLFNLEPTCRATLALERVGVRLDFVGDHPATLSHLLSDLSAAWDRGREQTPPLARSYGEDGGGARDPRTGVTAPRLKDVLKGRLDHFLDGWRQRDAGVAAAPD